MTWYLRIPQRQKMNKLDSDTSSKDEGRNRSYESRAARREMDDSYRSYDQHKESKRYSESDDKDGHRRNGSKKCLNSEEREGRHSSGFDSAHTKREETMRSDRTRSHRDSHDTGSDRRTSWRETAVEDYHRGHRDRHDTDSERRTSRKNRNIMNPDAITCPVYRKEMERVCTKIIIPACVMIDVATPFHGKGIERVRQERAILGMQKRVMIDTGDKSSETVSNLGLRDCQQLQWKIL